MWDPELMIAFYLAAVHITTIHSYRHSYSAIGIPHIQQSTVSLARGFSVSTSRHLATGLDTGTSSSNHYEVFLSLILQSPWKADKILRFYFVSLCTA
jgi:hypothetical protein